MMLLERYVFRRALMNSLGALASLVLIVWIVQALARVDIVKSTASAAGNVFWIALMLLPDLAAGIVPFAILIGAVQALNGLNADLERAVMSASGASPKVIAKPIVMLGVLGAILVLLISNVIGPMSSRAFRDGIRAVNADTITLFLQPGRFEKVQDGLELSIGSARGSNITSLFIADSRDPKVELIYFAREARIAQEDGRSLLLLSDGQLHRRDMKDDSVAVVQFQSYAFDLADLKPASQTRFDPAFRALDRRSDLAQPGRQAVSREAVFAHHGADRPHDRMALCDRLRAMGRGGGRAAENQPAVELRRHDARSGRRPRAQGARLPRPCRRSRRTRPMSWQPTCCRSVPSCSMAG